MLPPAAEPWNKDRAVGPRDPLTKAQISRICQALTQAANWRDLALFATAIDTGLRCSDLLQLKLWDIQTQIFATKQHKTGAPVSLELCDYTRDALQQWVIHADKDSHDYLFTPLNHTHRDPISRGHYRSLIKNWVSAIGLNPRRYSTHSLRRTKGALLWAHCKDLEVVRLILGHKDLRSTMSYLGIQQTHALNIAREVPMLPDQFKPMVNQNEYENLAGNSRYYVCGCVFVGL